MLLLIQKEKFKKLYTKYPYPNFDDEEYLKIENYDDDNIDEQKK